MKMKRLCHIYYPEAILEGKSVSISERYYIDYAITEDAKKKGITIKHYAEKQSKDFLKLLKSKQYKEDIFFIVLDVDKEIVNTVDEQKQIIRKSIIEQLKIARKNDIDIGVILSSKSFETYLCMYNNNLYKKPFQSNEQLIMDTKFEGYDKSKSWFQRNKSLLKFEKSEMIKKIELSRKQVFEQDNAKINDYNNPDYFNDTEFNELCRINPFTYFDLLIKKLL